MAKDLGSLLWPVSNLGTHVFVRLLLQVIGLAAMRLDLPLWVFFAANAVAFKVLFGGYYGQSVTWETIFCCCCR